MAAHLSGGGGGQRRESLSISSSFETRGRERSISESTQTGGGKEYPKGYQELLHAAGEESEELVIV